MQNRTVYTVVLLAFLSKCLLAGFVELNNDEVYYWTYAQKLQWSYFDHPPMIAVILKVFTVNLFFQNDLLLRLGPIVCGTVSTWLIFLIGKKIRNEATGVISVLLFTASTYACIIGGFLIIPDAPQLVCWLWSVLLMLQIVQPKSGENNGNVRLLLLGLSIGLCILCKVHGIFLWIGFIGFVIMFQRPLLKNRYLYLSMLITACLLSPIMLWNISNDFITYRYQGNRVAFFGALQSDSFFRELFGGMLYNNPINFVLIVTCFWYITQQKDFVAPPVKKLLISVALPLIAFVLFLSLFKDTLPHWTGPAYTTLIPLAAAFLDSRRKPVKKKLIPGVVKWALGLTITLLIAAIFVIKLLPVSIGSKEWEKLGEHDVTLDMNGWKQFALQFDSLHRQDVSMGMMEEHAFLIADYWFPAAHIDYYVARKYDYQFLAIGDLEAIHHYAWLNKSRPFLHKGSDAYFISVSNFYNPPAGSLAASFEKVIDTSTITQYRSGIPVRNFFIYRLKNYRGNIPGSGIFK